MQAVRTHRQAQHAPECGDTTSAGALEGQPYLAFAQGVTIEILGGIHGSIQLRSG
ncbi:hypothetical protein D3C72_2231860 [compost metagenome]